MQQCDSHQRYSAKDNYPNYEGMKCMVGRHLTPEVCVDILSHELLYRVIQVILLAEILSNITTDTNLILL